MESKKILILSHKPPYPKLDGGCIAIAQVLEALLEQGHQITFICMETDKHPSRNTLQHENLNYKSVYVDTRINVFGALKNLLSKQSYILSRFNQNVFNKKLRGILQSDCFDIVIFESLFTSSYLDTVNELSTAKKIYRSHNVEHLIWEEQSKSDSNIFLKKYLRQQARRLKKEEINFWNSIKFIASISNADSAHIAKFCSTKVNTVNIYVENRHLEQVDAASKIDFFHLGAMDWRPNQEAIYWLLNKVWPDLQKVENSAEIHIAGRGMPKKLINRKQKGFFNHHEVINALEFISEHKVMLVPLFSGSGIRVKIIEGMAMGKCIISTNIGVEGVSCTDKKNILIANTKEEFIEAMKFCIQNPERVNNIGAEAKKYAVENFSKGVITNQLNKLL